MSEHRCPPFKRTKTNSFGRTIKDWFININKELAELSIDDEYSVPIKFCPFCGIELAK